MDALMTKVSGNRRVAPAPKHAPPAPRVYPLGHSRRELDRLAVQAQRLAEDTVVLLKRAGIREGQRVLDIGCGPGDVSFHVADLVGPTGRVVGLDASADAIDAARARARDLGYHNVDFITGALGTYEDFAGFDAIVGRLILIYVDDPVAVLRGLRSCLRPGGLIVLQEPDGDTVGCMPECPLFLRMRSWVLAAFERAGSRVNLGSTLGGILRSAGYAVEGSFAWQPSLVGPTLVHLDWFAELVRTLLPIIVREGIATEQEVDVETLTARLYAEASALDAMVFKPRFVGVWARSESNTSIRPARRR